MNRRQGLYIISVAAQILQLHPQTLRKYERAGFVEPPRLGTLRLYSEEDIAQLRQIKYLVEGLGLTLAGVQLALNLTNKLLGVRAGLDADGNDDGNRSDEAVQGIDSMLLRLGVEVPDARRQKRPAQDRPVQRRTVVTGPRQ